MIFIKYKKTANSMNIPYTYLVKHKPSGRVYYGSRTSKHATPDDLWKKYFTSSKEVKQLIERDGLDSFAVEIRKTFKTKEECLRWEEKVLRRLHVRLDDRFINKNETHLPLGCFKPKEGWIGITNGTKNKFVPPGYLVPVEWSEGFTIKDESIKSRTDKIKAAHKDKIWITNDITNRKILPFESLPGGWRYGKTANYSQRSKDKMSQVAKELGQGTIWITNGSKNKRFRGESIPEGWYEGLSMHNVPISKECPYCQILIEGHRNKYAAHIKNFHPR